MNYKKLLVSVIVVVLIVVALVSGLGKTSSSTITIGASLPLTGVSASIGERVKNAIDIGLAEINSSRPNPIKVAYEDDKGDSNTAVTVVNKLISTDKTHVIIGLLKSDPMLAVAPITEKNKVILFSPTAGADAISDAGDFVFRNIEIPDSHGKGATEYFASKNIKKVALFTAQASNAKSYSAAFQKNFEASGGTIVANSEYVTTNTDFRTDIAKAMQAKAEAVYIGVATAKDVGVLVRQLREMKFSGDIVVSPAAEAKEFIDIAGASAEGVIVTAAPFDPAGSGAAKFAEEYSKKYGKFADGFAANGYDAIHILVDAIDSCHGDKDAECLRDYIYNLKDFDGAGGRTTFNNKGDVVKTVQLKVVRDGQFILVK